MEKRTHPVTVMLEPSIRQLLVDRILPSVAPSTISVFIHDVLIQYLVAHNHITQEMLVERVKNI